MTNCAETEKEKIEFKTKKKRDRTKQNSQKEIKKRHYWMKSNLPI